MPDKLTPQSKANVFLVGPMGSGKTTLGQALAEKIAYTFMDTDQICEERMDLCIDKIFTIHGEAYFRDLETQALEEACKLKKCVIATGGGIITRVENRVLLQQQDKVIFLDTSIEKQVERVSKEYTRPLLQNKNPHEILSNLYNERYAFYEEVARWTIRTDSYTVEKIVDKITSSLENQLKHG